MNNLSISTLIKEQIMQDKFEGIYDRFKKGHFTTKEASELLHCSERTFYRKRIDYDSGGLSNLIDRRLGNRPPNAVSTDKIEQILGYRNKYYEDYNGKHLQEELDRNHHLKVSYKHFKSYIINARDDEDR